MNLEEIAKARYRTLKLCKEFWPEGRPTYGDYLEEFSPPDNIKRAVEEELKKKPFTKQEIEQIKRLKQVVKKKKVEFLDFQKTGQSIKQYLSSLWEHVFPLSDDVTLLPNKLSLCVSEWSHWDHFYIRTTDNRPSPITFEFSLDSIKNSFQELEAPAVGLFAFLEELGLRNKKKEFISSFSRVGIIKSRKFGLSEKVEKIWENLETRYRHLKQVINLKNHGLFSFDNNINQVAELYGQYIEDALTSENRGILLDFIANSIRPDKFQGFPIIDEPFPSRAIFGNVFYHYMNSSRETCQKGLEQFLDLPYAMSIDSSMMNIRDDFFISRGDCPSKDIFNEFSSKIRSRTKKISITFPPRYPITGLIHPEDKSFYTFFRHLNVVFKNPTKFSNLLRQHPKFIAVLKDLVDKGSPGFHYMGKAGYNVSFLAPDGTLISQINHSWFASSIRNKLESEAGSLFQDMNILNQPANLMFYKFDEPKANLHTFVLQKLSCLGPFVDRPYVQNHYFNNVYPVKKGDKIIGALINDSSLGEGMEKGGRSLPGTIGDYGHDFVAKSPIVPSGYPDEIINPNGRIIYKYLLDREPGLLGGSEIDFGNTDEEKEKKIREVFKDSYDSFRKSLEDITICV